MKAIIFIVALFLAGEAALAQGSGSSAKYSIKEGEPYTGTRIRRNVAEWVLPFNRRYAELTAQEQGLLKSQYEAMPEADEPPFPLNGLQSIYKPIAEAHQKLLVAGDLIIDVDVDAQGQTTSVSVIKSPDPLMTRVAAAVLFSERFKPAVCSGIPCKMQFPLRIHFAKGPQ